MRLWPVSLHAGHHDQRRGPQQLTHCRLRREDSYPPRSPQSRNTTGSDNNEATVYLCSTGARVATLSRYRGGTSACFSSHWLVCDGIPRRSAFVEVMVVFAALGVQSTVHACKAGPARTRAGVTTSCAASTPRPCTWLRTVDHQVHGVDQDTRERTTAWVAPADAELLEVTGHTH